MQDSLSFIAPAESAVGAFLPFITSYEQTLDGAIPIGVEFRTNQIVWFDPVGWMRKGYAFNKIVGILGKIGHRKTTLAKYIAVMYGSGLANDGGLMRIYADQVRRNDQFPEYDSLARFNDSTPVATTERINIFDPAFSLTMSDHLTTAYDVFARSNDEAQADAATAHVIQVALAKMMNEHKSAMSMEVLALLLSRYTVEDSRTYRKVVLEGTLDKRLGSLPDSVRNVIANEADNLDKESLESAASLAYQRYMRLLEGDFSERFGGTVSMADRMQQQAVIMDMAGLNDQTLAFMQSFIWRVKKRAFLTQDRRFTYQIEIHDENYKMWNYLDYAREMSDYMKQIRGYDSIVLFMTHRLQDYATVGTVNSRQRVLATNMVQDIGSWFLGYQSLQSALALCDTIGITEAEARSLTSLRPGQWMLKVGSRPGVFIDTNYIIGDTMMDLTASNMTNDRAYAIQQGLAFDEDEEEDE